MEAILIPISFFAMVAAIVIAPKYFRSRDRARLLDTLRVAYDRGQPVPPDLIESLSFAEAQKVESPYRDLRSGLILIAVALAFVVLGSAIGYFEGEHEAWVISAIGAFPGFIGLALVALWFARRSRVGSTGV
jgi:purine-cytosine permease-like protein